MQLQVGVKVLLRGANNTYLFIERADPLPTGEGICWDIPGGRLKSDSDETLQEALLREVYEETGITLTATPKLLQAQDVFVPQNSLRVVRLTYLASIGVADLLLSAEHARVTWKTLSDALDLPTDPYLYAVLEAVTSA